MAVREAQAHYSREAHAPRHLRWQLRIRGRQGAARGGRAAGDGGGWGACRAHAGRGFDLSVGADLGWSGGGGGTALDAAMLKGQRQTSVHDPCRTDVHKRKPVPF